MTTQAPNLTKRTLAQGRVLPSAGKRCLMIYYMTVNSRAGGDRSLTSCGQSRAFRLALACERAVGGG